MTCRISSSGRCSSFILALSGSMVCGLYEATSHLRYSCTPEHPPPKAGHAAAGGAGETRMVGVPVTTRPIPASSTPYRSSAKHFPD